MQTLVYKVMWTFVGEDALRINERVTISPEDFHLIPKILTISIGKGNGKDATDRVRIQSVELMGEA